MSIRQLLVKQTFNTDSRRPRLLAVCAVVAMGLGLGACSEGDASRPQGPAGQAQGGRPGSGGPGGPTSVIAAPVELKNFAGDVEAIGTARANEAVTITAKVSNTVTAIRFREGEEVKAGDVLIELDTEQARANLAEAEAALSDSESQFKRSKELFATRALSESQLDQLEATLKGNQARVAAARAQLSDQIIRAPFSGRVGLRNISLGSLISPGTVITTLDDTRIIKLDFSVPEVFLPVVREGQEINARATAYPEEVFKGKVQSIDSRIDPVSRSIIVRAEIANPERRLKPGMFMTVRLVRSEKPSLVIPEQALVPEGDRQFVYVVHEGKAVQTEVKTGRRRPGEVEILSGLAQGDSVVIEGTQKVRDGAAVRPFGAEDRPT